MSNIGTPCTVTHINHTCIAVKDINKTLNLYAALFGIEVGAIEEIPDQKVRATLVKIGQTQLELIEPTDPEGTIARFIERKGEGLHHIAFEVDDIAEKVSLLKSQGVDMIDSEPRVGLSGTIAFLHPRATAGVLIELVEP